MATIYIAICDVNFFRLFFGGLYVMATIYIAICDGHSFDYVA
jgi:hypothetical protein